MVRVKRRYALFRLHGLPEGSKLNITTSDIYTAVKQMAYQVFGLCEAAKITHQFHVKYFNIYTGIGYFSVLHRYHAKMLGVINFITSIAKYTCSFHTLHVSATIKMLQKFLIKYHEKCVKNALRNNANISKEHRENMENSIKAELNFESDDEPLELESSADMIAV